MNNVDGKMKIKHHHQGTILDVNVKNIRQVWISRVNYFVKASAIVNSCSFLKSKIFTRIECNSLSEIDDIRFKYFIEKVKLIIYNMSISFRKLNLIF